MIYVLHNSSDNISVHYLQFLLYHIDVVDIKRRDNGALYAESIRYESWDAEAKRIEKLKKEDIINEKESI